MRCPDQGQPVRDSLENNGASATRKPRIFPFGRFNLLWSQFSPCHSARLGFHFQQHKWHDVPMMSPYHQNGFGVPLKNASLGMDSLSAVEFRNRFISKVPGPCHGALWAWPPPLPTPPSPNKGTHRYCIDAQFNCFVLMVQIGLELPCLIYYC